MKKDLNCKNCGNPKIMYWCNECESNSEDDTCLECGKTILIDKDYHKDCPSQ